MSVACKVSKDVTICASRSASDAATDMDKGNLLSTFVENYGVVDFPIRCIRMTGATTERALIWSLDKRSDI
jgi:hypothetical protein